MNAQSSNMWLSTLVCAIACRHAELFQQLLSRSGLSPESSACRPPSALHHAINHLEAGVNSHSAPEPSSRVASPMHTHTSRLRPASASAAVSNRPHLSQFEQSLSQAASAGLSQHPDMMTGSAEGGSSGRQDSAPEGLHSLGFGDGIAENQAAHGQTSIIQAVAVAQQQAGVSNRHPGRLSCRLSLHT